MYTVPSVNKTTILNCSVRNTLYILDILLFIIQFICCFLYLFHYCPRDTMAISARLKSILHFFALFFVCIFYFCTFHFYYTFILVYHKLARKPLHFFFDFFFSAISNACNLSASIFIILFSFLFFLNIY